METLINLESFVRSAEAGSFSSAARRMQMTPAAVARNVGQLERNLGVPLFERTPQGLEMTDDGERFLESVKDNLEHIHGAISDITANAGQPSGVLKVGAGSGLVLGYLLPLMPVFVATYPAVVPEWTVADHLPDLLSAGLDVTIASGLEAGSGTTLRQLAPGHTVAVASPACMLGKSWPQTPHELNEHDSVQMRSAGSGKLRQLIMCNAAGAEMVADQKARLIVNDQDAMLRSVLLGMGIGLLPMAQVLPHLESGALVRLLPGWYADAGPISLLFTSRKRLPAKTRVFVEFIREEFRDRQLARRLSAV